MVFLMSAITKWIENYLNLQGQSITLDNYQKRFLDDTTKFRYVNKSRRVGFTQTLSWEVLFRAMTIPNTWAAIISVSDRVAKDVMKVIYDAFYSYRDKMVSLGQPDAIPKFGTRSKSDLSFPEVNSRIQSLPTNARTIRGATITDLYLDEFAHYQNAEEIYGAILPSITLDRGDISSRITMISTPLSKFGPYYKFWTLKGKPEGKHISYHVIHWKECPRLVKNIEFIKSSMDEDTFLREYCNAFVDETMAGIPFNEIKACVDYNLADLMDFRQIRNPIYVGVDYGKVYDSTVIIIVEKTETEFIIRHIKEFQPTKEVKNSYREAADYIIRNTPRWKPSRIVVDATGVGLSTIEDLRELGSVVKGETLTLPYKERIFTFMKTLFQDRKIRIPDNEKLINQIHAVQKKITESGQIRYTHPTKGDIKHDDYTWALALALYAGETGSNIGGGGIGLKGSTWDLKRDDEPDLGIMY